MIPNSTMTDCLPHDLLIASENNNNSGPEMFFIIVIIIIISIILFFFIHIFFSFFFSLLEMSNKRRKPSNRGSGPWGKATGGSVKGALLAGRVDWGLWGWSPTGFGSEEAALLGAGAVGHWAVVRVSGVTLCITVGLSPGDALLLAPP